MRAWRRAGAAGATDTSAAPASGALGTAPGRSAAAGSPDDDRPGDSATRRAVRRFRRDTPALVALGFLLLLAAVALLAPIVAPADPDAQDLLNQFDGPSAGHLLGTDDLGRDVFSRLVFGTRASVRASVQIVALALAASVPLGLLAGYLGGRVDNVLMRVMDAMLSFPPLILALAVAGVLGPGLTNATIAIAIVMVPGFVRLVRGQALAVSQESFVEASRAVGTRTPTILRKRILPSVASPLIVQSSIALGGALLAEASLSYLGLGVQPPTPSWGSMLRRSYDFIFTEPWQMVVPGAMIAVTVLAFNTLGDGLRDALGVQLRKERGRGRRRLGITDVAEPAPPAEPAGTAPLLDVRDLRVAFDTEAGLFPVVDGVTFSVAPGEVLGLVGESGSGKTVTSLAVMRLVPSPPGRITGGSIRFEGRDLLQLGFDEMRAIRGNDIAMVFQDPMTSLNPAFTIGDQLVEAQRLHRDLPRRAARARALELLDLVGIPGGAGRLDEYPHRFSGGMRQRALIAVALACEPKLLIADEPTTALDVTVQAQILDLLRGLQREMGTAVIFVTHDLGVIADICDRVAVMYAGQIVEQADVDDLFERPRHPYTEGLLGSMPQAGVAGDRLTSIAGVVPDPGRMPAGCRFAPRCPYAEAACRDGAVPIAMLPGGREARCVRVDELDLRGAE